MSRWKTRVRKDLRSAYQAFKNKWCDCQLCPLSKNRRKIVHFRGWIPAHVLFIGEAPGESEDMTGLPFVGAAGHLAQDMIEEAHDRSSVSVPLRYAFINLVGCIPNSSDQPGCIQIRPPHKEEIRACETHLRELLALIRPFLIVTLGTVAADNLPQDVYDDDTFDFEQVIHPSAILRMGSEQRAGTAYATAIRKIQRGLEASML